MKKTMQNNRSEQGNVLFLILIAVALFAALSYAVTKSTSGGGNADNETNILNAATITQYPSALKTAVLRMTINGAPEALLDFTVPANVANLNSTALQDDNLFHSEGGGVSYQTASSKVMADGNAGTWVFNAENNVLNIGTDGAPAAANIETIAFLPGVKQGICLAIVKEIGLTAIPVQLTGLDIVTQKVTSGANAPTVQCDSCVAASIITAGGDLDGKSFGCFENVAASGSYVYYHVLAEN